MTTKLAIGICLDESSSMQPQTQTTIDGLNEYLAGIDPEARVTITAFAENGLGTGCRPIFVNQKAAKTRLSRDTYHPSGMTPLYDAIGSTIKSLERWVDDNGKQHTVLFVIQTDGMENASREWSREQVADLIRWKENVDGWKFIYLGADQDQFLAERLAASIGLSAGSTVSYASITTESAYSGLRGATVAMAAAPNMNSAELAEEAKKQYKNAGGKDVNGGN